MPVRSAGCSRWRSTLASYGSLLLVTAAIAALINLFSSGDQQAGTVVIALGFTAWSLIAIAYLVIFWSGAGRTPGMSFVAIRMLSEDGRPVAPARPSAA